MDTAEAVGWLEFGRGSDNVVQPIGCWLVGMLSLLANRLVVEGVVAGFLECVLGTRPKKGRSATCGKSGGYDITIPNLGMLFYNRYSRPCSGTVSLKVCTDQAP